MLRNGEHIYKSIWQKQQQLTRKNYVLQVSLKLSKLCLFQILRQKSWICIFAVDLNVIWTLKKAWIRMPCGIIYFWLHHFQWRYVFTTCSIRRRHRGQLVKWEEHVVQQHMCPHLELQKDFSIRETCEKSQTLQFRTIWSSKKEGKFSSLRNKNSIVLVLKAYYT